MGTCGGLFLVSTMNYKNTLAICLGTCRCDMNCITVIAGDGRDGCTVAWACRACGGYSFGQKESPGGIPELCMDLSECTVVRKAN